MIKYNACPQVAAVSGRKVLESPGGRRSWGCDAPKLEVRLGRFQMPWTARRSNQSILKEINPEYSLKGLMLKLHYFGHLMQRANSLEKTLMLGKIESKRRSGWQRMRRLGGITDFSGHEFEQAPGDSGGQGSLSCCSPQGPKESDMT